MQTTPPFLQAESEELKSLLMKVKEESEKDGLKLNIKNTTEQLTVSGTSAAASLPLRDDSNHWNGEG